MQDLSKIDFSKCKLPEWSGRQVTATFRIGRAAIMLGGNIEIAFRGGVGWVSTSEVRGALVSEIAELDDIGATVDAFIESELAKQSESEWRPCSIDFAFAHIHDSQVTMDPERNGWLYITDYPYPTRDCFDSDWSFRTKAPLQQQPNRLDTRNPGRAYSAKSPAAEPTITDLAAQVKRLRRLVRKLEKREEKAK